MAGHRITHIRKRDPAKECRLITNVKMDGRSVSVPDIVKMMQGSGSDGVRHTFYIEADGVRVSVKLAPDDADPTYIRTERMDSPYDNMLSLPRF